MPAPHGGDRAVAGVDGVWIIEARLAKGWSARRPATRTTAEYPGTAISWDGALFEVIRSEATVAGARYVLAPWEDRHTIRTLEPYDDASEARRADGRADDRRRRERRKMLLLLSPLAGHAPADVQDEWEREYDAPASLLTFVSALPLFLFGILCSLSLAIRGFTGVSILPLSSSVLLIGLYLMIESGMRLSAVWGQGRPAGSLAGSLAWEVFKRVRAERQRRDQSRRSA